MTSGSLASFTSLLRVASRFGMVALASLAGCASAHAEDVASSEHADTANAQTIAACPSDGSDVACPAGSFAVTCANGTHQVATVAQVKGDQICNAGTRGTLSCQVSYLANTGAVTQVGSFALAVDQTYPELNGRALGDSTLPFSAQVSAVAKRSADGTALPSDGYIDLGITDNATHTGTSAGEAEISLAGLGQSSPSEQVSAGYLEARVPPFVYQSVTYQNVLVTCYVSPSH